MHRDIIYTTRVIKYALNTFSFRLLWNGNWPFDSQSEINSQTGLCKCHFLITVSIRDYKIYVMALLTDYLQIQ